MTAARLSVLWGLPVALLAGAIAAVTVAPRWTERTLAPRSGERSIGLFDPHLHLSVTDVQVAEASDRTPRKRLWIVTVRARNDAARIDIDPSGLALVARSSDGGSCSALEHAGNPERRFDTRLRGILRPGDSIDQTFLFELPVDTASPFLVIQSEDGPLAWLPTPVVYLLGGRVELAL